MSKWLRTVLIVGLVVVMVLPTLGGTWNSAKAQDQKVLSIWVREEQLEPAFDAYNAKMEAEGQNVRVEYTIVSGDEFPVKFTTALAAGAVPDIVSIDLIFVPYYNSIGTFLDLTDRFEAYEFKDQLAKPMLALGTWEDRIYALPFAADASALIYNRGLFEQAGLDPDKPPTNWDELIQYSQALTKDGVYGYGFSGGSAGGLMFTMMPWAWANGGKWVSEDGTTAQLDDPKTVEAVQMFTDMINEYKVTPPGTTTYTYDDFQNAFKQEQIAMMTTGNFVISDLTRNFPDIDFGVALIPSKDGSAHSSFIGGDLIAIPAATRYPEEAWDLIEFLLSEEVQVEVFAKNGGLPVRLDLHDNAYFEAEPRYKVFAQTLEVGFVPFTTVYNELYNPFQTGMQEAFLMDKPVEEALADASAEMQKVIDRGPQ